MMKILIAGVAGSIILFVWGALSWMALPWHNQTLGKFSDEAALLESITAQAPASGVYIAPNPHHHAKDASEEERQAEMQASMSRYEQGPIVFAAVHRGGAGHMGTFMFRSFLIQFVCALLAAVLLARARLQSYTARVGFIVMLGLFAGLACHLPYWNWWHFSTAYTAVAMADLLIGWWAAGMAIAGLVGENRRNA